MDHLDPANRTRRPERLPTLDVPMPINVRHYVRVEQPNVQAVTGVVIGVHDWPAPSLTIRNEHTGREDVVFIGPGTQVRNLGDAMPAPHPGLA